MSEHNHDHSHDHDDSLGHSHAPEQGPLADAKVRAAKATDAPAVGLVQAQVWTTTYAGRVPHEVVSAFTGPAFASAWRASLSNPPQGAHRLLVALAGDQVVGLIAIGPNQDPDGTPERAEITELDVHPAARQAGHGSRLLNAAVDQLRDLGAHDLVVWVLTDDDATRLFFTGAGFAPDGAYRDRVVSPEGATLREVRLITRLGADPAGD